MKRKQSRATLYKKIKQRTTVCLNLSQDYSFNNNVLLTSNVNDEVLCLMKSQKM